jgi:aminoglycoside phosphotransferase family enzyme/predicted kinase
MAERDPAQADVIAFLVDPASHGLGEGAVKRVDTHGSVVFLAGPRVYKIKRAVRYPYLDYSTLAKRKAAVVAEIEANKPFSAELYEGMIAITRDASGRLAIGGNGRPVEWSLVMRRFDENATLDKLAGRGDIGDALARALGEAVAAAHEKAPPFDADVWIEALGKFVADEIATMRAAPEVIPTADAKTLGDALEAALEKIRPLLRARGRMGHIRRCHGDLHLRNVALIDGRPALFDALEFDPVVAAGDVLYDLAFLLMDLLVRKLDRAANIVFNRYLVASARDEHLDALAALPFFLALRAAIRARVALDKRKIVEGKDRVAAETEAKDYAALAARLIAPSMPTLVAIGGLSGTGKTTIGMGIAPAVPPAPGAVHLRSDIERKRLAGVGELHRLPPDAYTPEAAASVYARLNGLAKRVLAAGHSALIDAVYARPDERDTVEKIATGAGVLFQGIWLELSVDERVRRVSARTGDASDADAGIARAQEEYEPGEVRWHHIEAAGTAGEVVKRALRALGF